MQDTTKHAVVKTIDETMLGLLEMAVPLFPVLARTALLIAAMAAVTGSLFIAGLVG